MATTTCSRRPAHAQWLAQQLLFRDATSAVFLFSTYLLYSGQLWQQLCSISSNGVAAPVQDVGTAHPASQQVWHIMCWAGSQATGTGSIGPGPSGLQQAWPFINKAVSAFLLAGLATQDLFHTLSPILRLALLLLFALPPVRRALLPYPHWRSAHHMVQRLLPMAAALHGVLGKGPMSASLAHALPYWLKWGMPLYMGWMSCMLVLPIRLQVVTGLLEWALYSGTSVMFARRMQEVGPIGLQLVAWPFLVLFVLPTWGVVLHSRGLQVQYQLLLQRPQRAPEEKAVCSQTGKGGCKGVYQQWQAGQSSRRRRRAAALRRCASAPGGLGTHYGEEPEVVEMEPGGAACSSTGSLATLVPYTSAGARQAISSPSAAAAHQFLQLVAAAQPLVFPDDVGSSSRPLVNATGRMSTSAPSLTLTAASSGTSGTSGTSGSSGNWQQALNSTSSAQQFTAAPMPSAAIATAAEVATTAGEPIVEEPPEDDVDIAALTESLRPRLVGLLGAQLGEQLLASFSGDARPGDMPFYASRADLVPLSVKVDPGAGGPSHDAVAHKLTSTVHHLLQHIPDDTGASSGALPSPAAAPGTIFGPSRPRVITSICVQGCVQLLGSMYTLPHQLVASSRSAPGGTGAVPAATSSSSNQGLSSGAESSCSHPRAGVAAAAEQPHPSAAGQLLRAVLDTLHEMSATAAGHQGSGCKLPAASSARAPAVAVWMGSHTASSFGRGSVGKHPGPHSSSSSAGSSSSLDKLQVATHPTAAPRLRLVSTYPICVTSGAASTLRLYLQSPDSEGYAIWPRRQQQQQMEDANKQLQAEQVAVAGRVRVLAHMQGRLLVDKEVAQDSCISLDLPDLPMGVLVVVLLCANTHQPLVTTPILVLPALAAEDLEQVWAAHLATGKADIDSAMAVGCATELVDITQRIWAQQMQPVVVDMASLMLATSSEGQAGVTVRTAPAASPSAATAATKSVSAQQLQHNHGAASGTGDIGGAVRHLAGHLICYLAGMGAYSLVELLTTCVAAPQEAVGDKAVFIGMPAAQAMGVAAGRDGASTAATTLDLAEGAGGGTSACCSGKTQMLSRTSAGAGGSQCLPEPATPTASLERQKLLASSPQKRNSSSVGSGIGSSSSSSSSSSMGSGIGSCRLRCTCLSWEPVRTADAFIALHTLLMALRVSLEVPEGRSAGVGVAVLLGWHLVLLGPTLALVVQKEAMVGWRRDVLCLGWSAGAAVYMAALAHLGLLSPGLLIRAAAPPPWAHACLGLVNHGVWRPLITQATPSCCILMNLLLSGAAVYAHACMGASWDVVGQLAVSQMLTAVTGPLITHWAVQHVSSL